MSVHRPFILLLLTWVAATAQQPAEVAPPGVPVPGVNPPPAGVPANIRIRNAKPSLGDNKIVEDIIEPKLSGNQLAGLYRKYTGRRVIVASAASTAEFAFIQEASPEDPLTYAKAAELLRKAATIENFIFVPDEEDTNLDFLTLATGGIRPTGIGIDVYNENTELPVGDAVISYVMNLNYIKPAEAVNTFTQIIGQFGAYGSIAAVPNAAAVVITENTSLIRKLIDLKAEIDVPSSKVATRWIPVQFADVTEIADTLTELLTAQQSTQKTAGVQRAQAPAGLPPGTAAGQGGSSSGEETPVQIIPETRTNRIFAMGRPVDLLFVEGLVREFDIPTSDKTFLRRKLRFLTVSDFLPIANDALSRAFSSESSGGGTSGGRSGGRSTGQTNNRTQSNNRQSTNNNNSRNSSRFGGSSGGSRGGSSGFGGGSSGGGASLGDPSVSSAPESMLVGRTLLVADNITNSIVAQGPPSALEIVERLLDQIDVKPDQVMISTVIGMLTLSKNQEYGVNYLLNGTDFKAGGGGGGGGLLPILPDAGARFPGFDPASIGSSGFRAIGTIDNLSIYLKALQSKTDFTVLSRPSIFTSNNQKGTISSGERIAIPTSSNSFSNGGASTNIEYQDVVLKLEVIPLVNSDNEITMQIALLNDEQNGVQLLAGAGSNGDDLEVPRISTREILTTATVPNGETIVLGGLIVGKNNQTKSGIPILSDIPYLGALFSTTEDNNDRNELMVFIQPSIVSNARDLADVQYDMDERYNVSSKVRNFANGGSPNGEEDLKETQEKGKGGSPAPYQYPKKAHTKKSLRPIHRR